MPGRRAFLIECGCLVAAPAFARIGSTTEAGIPPGSTAAGVTPAAMTTSPVEPQEVVLRIDGWEAPGELPDTAGGEVWISLNSSWQSAWR